MSKNIVNLILFFGLVAGLVFGCMEAQAKGRIWELEVQRRNAETGEVTVRKEIIDSTRTCLLVIDMWDYHWCTTWCGRAGTLAPRMNKVNQIARKLGIQVVHSPTDCSNGHAGTLQRERMAAMTKYTVPEPDKSLCPDAPWSFGLGSGCMCGGPYPCAVSYANLKIYPGMEIAENDLISSGHKELYNLCKERGYTHLLYTGGATNMCLVQKPEGMINMTRLGFNCILLRDVTEAHGPANSSDDADAHTAYAVEYIEKNIGPSTNIEDTFRKMRLWDKSVVDSVLILPWGFKNRPKFFDDILKISMSIPRIRVKGAQIRYTLDGSEPTRRSKLYTKPFNTSETTMLRAAAFKGGKKVGLESEGYYHRLLPRPALPDVYISDLEPVKINMSAWSEWYDQGPAFPPPQKDRTLKKEPLVLRGVKYEKGMGLRAFAQLIYKVKPEYEYFVARAGVEESCLGLDTGRGKAQWPSVVFKVFIDGKLMAESPVMRISQEPWRFNVKIPPGSRVISLATMDAGDGNRGDYANWVNAGFVLKKKAFTCRG